MIFVIHGTFSDIVAWVSFELWGISVVRIGWGHVEISRYRRESVTRDRCLVCGEHPGSIA